MGSNKVRKERSKFKEVERIYFCIYPNCSKGYGRLNHLNDHIKIQQHGELRKPSEFALVRKQLKRRKLQEEILQETLQVDQTSSPTLIKVDEDKEKVKTSLPPIFVTTQLPLSPSQLPPSPHVPFFQSHQTTKLAGTLPHPLDYSLHHFQQYILNSTSNNSLLLMMLLLLLPSPPTILPPLNISTGAGYLSSENAQRAHYQYRPQLN